MLNIWIMWLIIIITALVGGGLGYFLYLKLKPKKQFWNAKVYQLSDGIKKVEARDESGKLVKSYELSDLIPYCKDIIVKSTDELGRETYTLFGLNKTTKKIEAEDVEVWGVEKVVHVLLKEGEAVIIRKGFDDEVGKIIYKPMSRDRIETMKTEIILRKKRFDNNKNVLSQITPWIVAGIMGMVLIGSIYLTMDGLKEIGKQTSDAQLEFGKNMETATNNYKYASEMYKDAILTLRTDITDLNNKIEELETKQNTYNNITLGKK